MPSGEDAMDTFSITRDAISNSAQHDYPRSFQSLSSTLQSMLGHRNFQRVFILYKDHVSNLTVTGRCQSSGGGRISAFY